MCSVFTVGPRFNTPVLLQMRSISIVQSLPFSKHSNVCVNGKKKQEQIKVNKNDLFISQFVYFFKLLFSEGFCRFGNILLVYENNTKNNTGFVLHVIE